MSENKQFTLKSGNADFTQRQKNVFDQLLLLETNRKPTQPDETQMDVDEEDVNSKVSSQREQRAITRKLRGKESIFKKPQNPISKNYMRKIPDFKKNPHKWTRYSLDDVNEEDMSDRSNTKAALSFIEELRERRISEVPSDHSEPNVSQKIVFKKQNTHETNAEVKEDPEGLKPTFRSSKVVMPEYVVGQRVKKDKKKKQVEKGRELKLDHLYEDE